MPETYAADDYAAIATGLRGLETAKRHEAPPLEAPCSQRYAIWCKTSRWGVWLSIIPSGYTRTPTPNTYETAEAAEQAIAARRITNPSVTYTVKPYP